MTGIAVGLDPHVTRRSFLQAGAALGGGLVIGWHLPASAAPGAAFAPNAFVRIARDGSVALTIPQVEMGQGTYTSMAMLIAEELDVDLAQVQVDHAPADDKRFANPLLGFQVTGGSTSVRAFYLPLRQAGAAARAMLIAAAADSWKVDPSGCHTEAGVVVHDASSRRLSYGDLVDAAAKLPVPTEVQLKDPSAFRIIGTPAKRLDVAGKVNGTAVFGIDVKVPGMKIATVAASPVVRRHGPRLRRSGRAEGRGRAPRRRPRQRRGRDRRSLLGRQAGPGGRRRPVRRRAQCLARHGRHRGRHGEGIRAERSDRAERGRRRRRVRDGRRPRSKPSTRRRSWRMPRWSRSTAPCMCAATAATCGSARRSSPGPRRRRPRSPACRSTR